MLEGKLQKISVRYFSCPLFNQLAQDPLRHTLHYEIPPVRFSGRYVGTSGALVPLPTHGPSTPVPVLTYQLKCNWICCSIPRTPSQAPAPSTARTQPAYNYTPTSSPHQHNPSSSPFCVRTTTTTHHNITTVHLNLELRKG